ncbi:ATP-binding protein [Catenovulum sediminis]|uniref:ATP-binding protein n=1 Tax=Catenovulum sediminis TaxID=1740262 RepID=A0ABV1RJZ3_9ALTE|nr:ATP-binding protein [Catenovulum sediminis]
MAKYFNLPAWVVLLVAISIGTFAAISGKSLLADKETEIWLHQYLKNDSGKFVDVMLKAFRQPLTQINLMAKFISVQPTLTPEEYNALVLATMKDTDYQYHPISLAAFQTTEQRLQHLWSYGIAKDLTQDQLQSTLNSLHRAATKYVNQFVYLSDKSHDLLYVAKLVQQQNNEFLFVSQLDSALLETALHLQAWPKNIDIEVRLSTSQENIHLLSWQFGEIANALSPSVQLKGSLHQLDFVIDTAANGFYPTPVSHHASNKLFGQIIFFTLILCLLIALLIFKEYKTTQRDKTLVEKLEQTQDQLTQAQQNIKRTARLAIINDMAPIAAAEITPAITQSIKAIASLEERTVNLKAKLEGGKVTKSLVSNHLDNALQLVRISSSQLMSAAESTYNLEQFANDLADDPVRKINLQIHVNVIKSTFQKTFKHKKVKFIENIPADIELNTHSGSLTHMLCILFNNCIEHGFNGKTDGIIMIEAFVDRKTQNINLRLEDNGVGIAEDKIEQVLISESNDAHSGLALASLLVQEKLAGQIQIKSKVGKFTRVTVSLTSDLSKQKRR